MAGFTFRRHMAFDWNGAQFRIERLQPNGDVLIEALHTGALSIVQRQQLLDEYTQGNVQATDRPPAPSSTALQPPFSRPLDELPEHVRREVQRRRRYLEAICADGKPVFTASWIRPILAAVAAELNEPKPPGVATVYRWYSRHRALGDTRSLIPRFDRRGSTKLRQDDQVLQLAEQAIAEAFEASPLATGHEIYTRLCMKIDAENRGRLMTTPLRTPSQRTVYRMLKRVDMYDLTRLREGKAAADRRFQISKRGVRTTRILERVEVDHTPLDLFLVDEKTWLPLGRPTLTMMLDHYSRFPLGYYLSFGNPSAAAVVGALRHAILPKRPAEPVIPNLKVEGKWLSYGIPDTLVLDNGLEFHGVDLDVIAFDLGISLVYCPRRGPRFKGAVERYLKTINYFFAHQLPGTSFARFHQRGDYDPQKHAVLTMGEFTHLFEKWVIDVYGNTEHRGIGIAPLRRWAQGLATHEPQLPGDLRSLQRRIGQTTDRKVRCDGFALHGIRYNEQTLAPILMRYSEGVVVRVTYDPDDLGEVSVWGPDDEQPVTVRAVDYEYARGLSVAQNTLLREAAREANSNADDAATLMRYRGELTQSISELMISRKLNARRRSAALRNISSTTPHGALPPPASAAAPPAAPTVSRPKKERPETDNFVPTLLPAFELQRTANHRTAGTSNDEA